jgi:hypothetical protein
VRAHGPVAASRTDATDEAVGVAVNDPNVAAEAATVTGPAWPRSVPAELANVARSDDPLHEAGRPVAVNPVTAFAVTR